jgi:hypothetical protein
VILEEYFCLITCVVLEEQSEEEEYFPTLLFYSGELPIHLEKVPARVLL